MSTRFGSDSFKNKQYSPDESERLAPIPGKDTGNFTMVAQHLFRYWMPVLSDRAWKALCIVIDHTWGYHQQQAFISLSTFKRELGLPPGQDEPVYRVLRELFFFQVLGVSNERGKRGIKAYFITETTLTTYTPLVVQEGKLYVTTHMGLVELHTLREGFSSPQESSSPHTEFVVKLYPIADQPRQEWSPRDSRQKAKYTAKDTDKDETDTLSVQPERIALEREGEQQEVKKKPQRKDTPLPRTPSPQETQPALVTEASYAEEEELEDIWGRTHFPGEDDLKRLLDGLRREAAYVSMPGVAQKKYAQIQAVRAEYVRKKNASIQAYQQMQATYNSTVDESRDALSAEPEAMERWDEPEQVPEPDEERDREHPALHPDDLLTAVAQAEQRLATQAQEVAALRAASAEAKRQYGFGSPEWGKAESRKRQAITLQQHLEDELQSKRDQCHQAGVPLSAAGEAVPLPFKGAEQIAVVPPSKPARKATSFNRETHMTQVRQQAATIGAKPTRAARPAG
jgi:hypothetical protein